MLKKSPAHSTKSLQSKSWSKIQSKINPKAWKESQSKFLVKKLDIWASNYSFFGGNFQERCSPQINNCHVTKQTKLFLPKLQKQQQMSLFFPFKFFPLLLFFSIKTFSFLALNNCPHSWVVFPPTFKNNWNNATLGEERPKPTKKEERKIKTAAINKLVYFFDCIFFCLSGAMAVKNKTLIVFFEKL